MSRARLRVKEKLLWRGFEFRLSRADRTEAHWQMKHGRLRAKLLYRDIGDPDAPPEFTAWLHLHELAEASGCAESADLALQYALRHLTENLRDAVRLLSELRRGKQAASE